MRADALPRRSRRRRAGDRLRAGGQREHRRVRSVRRDLAAAREHGAWVHVDGAFGLWAPASPGARGLGRPASAGADSWATDAHKWLNVPYDCGIVVVRDRGAHAAAMAMPPPTSCAGERGEPLELRLGPRSRHGGRAGSRSGRRCARSAAPAWPNSIERCCVLARRLADGDGAAAGVEILNEVVLNQVLVRFGGDDAFTDAVIGRVQADGTCWVGGTSWRGQAAMRISVSNWSTTEGDIDHSVVAILSASTGARRAS